MENNEFHQIVLDELRAVKTDLSGIRSMDIPELKTELAVFKQKTNTSIEDLKKQTRWSTRLYTVIGGAIAVAIAKFTGGSH